MINRTPYIHRISLDLTEAPVTDRVELWSDFLRTNFDVSLIGDSAAVDPPRSSSWLLGKVILSESTFGDAVMHRRQQHISNDHDGLLLLEVRRNGVQHNNFGRESFVASPGDVTILDYSNAYLGRSTAASVTNLIVSHTAVGYDPGRHPKIVRLPGDSVVAHVLRNTILNVRSVLDRTTRAEAASFSRGLIGLLRGILFENANTASPSFATARSRAIRDYIEQNLGHQKLNADVICAQFNVSRATVYRDFKDDGGLERYVLARKLEAALGALSFGPRERGAVSRAAEQWGFASTGHFGREFRRRFGFLPSEIVAEGRHTRSTQEHPAVVRDEREMDKLVDLMRRL